MKMTYSDTFKSNVSTALLDIATFNGNSIYDPDALNGGDSDRGFTQMTQLYERYVVTGCSINVSVINMSVDQIRTIALLPSTKPSSEYTPMYYNGIKGQPYVVMRDLTPLAGPRSMVRLKSYMTTAKMFGLPKLSTTISTVYSGTNSSNPTGTGLWFWHLCFLKSDITPPMNVQFKVEMTHYVKFFQRRVTPL